jgi:hypothetical protein
MYTASVQGLDVGQDCRVPVTSAVAAVSHPSMTIRRILTPEGIWTGARKHGLGLVENL